MKKAATMTFGTSPSRLRGSTHDAFCSDVAVFFINAGVPNVNVDTKSFESGGLRLAQRPYQSNPSNQSTNCCASGFIGACSRCTM
jgi:hypothetical protein